MATTVSEMSTAVIGDVIGSRQHPDRADLQRTLLAAFEVVDRAMPAVQPFTMTIGDEFQGLFESLDEAIFATFRLQVALVDIVRLRFGIGVGEVIRLAGHGPFEQDGSAWWRAREALDRVRTAERSNGAPPRWVTGLVTHDPATQAITQGYLQLRDHVLGGVDRVDADIVAGLMSGATQISIAGRLGIDKGAVSRRVGRHGLSALLWSLPTTIDAVPAGVRDPDGGG
jgi:hypothetical protein